MSATRSTWGDSAFVDLRLGNDRWSYETNAALCGTAERLLGAAGIGRGMRVLNLFCGYGALTFAAASRVGDTGTVVGVDSHAGAIDVAKSHSRRCRYKNVRFDMANAFRMRVHEPFDAVIFRHVLSGQRDPAAFLRSVRRLVRVGGVLAVQEMDLSKGVRSVPPLPELRAVNDVTTQALDRCGVLSDAGGRLVDLFDEAGMPWPMMFSQSIVGSGYDHQLFALIDSTVNLLAPYMTAEEAARIDVDTLGRRLQLSAVRLRSQIEFIPQICAWVRLD